MGGKAKFKKGQKCLVPHTDQYYAAHVSAVGTKRAAEVLAGPSHQSLTFPAGLLLLQILQAQKRGDEGYFYLLHYE